MQDVRFRRGLEGELAQSIMTLDAVDSARVHLSIAKTSSFVASDGEKSSASVVLAMKPGRDAERRADRRDGQPRGRQRRRACRRSA